MFLFLLGLFLFVPLANAKEVTVPLNIGFGPSVYHLNAPLGLEQSAYYGIHLDLAAVIDKETLAKNQRKIPKKYRKMVKRLGEVKISHLLIPDALIISPRVKDTAMYGVTFRPVGIGQPIGTQNVRLKLNAGLLLTYAYISQSVQTTHFLRPGIDLGATIEIKLHPRFIVSGGYALGVYIPQTLGGFGLGIGENSLWSMGQGFVLLNYRHPFTTNL